MAKKPLKKQVLVILIIAAVLLIAGSAVFYALNAGNTARHPESSTAGIRYEPNTTAIKGGVGESGNSGSDTGAGNKIALHFAAGATSSDGENFACTLGNPHGAVHDIYFDIYADSGFTEEIYLSGLVAPGTQIESFKSSKKFPDGTTDVLAVITTVDDDHETLLMQTTVVLTLIVG